MADSPSHYDSWFAKLTDFGASDQDAAVAVIHRYLDGKPTVGYSQRERDAALWSSTFWEDTPDEVFRTEGFALALAKYLGRNQEQKFSQSQRAFTVAPEACKRAIRYSKVFLDAQSSQWQEVQNLIDGDPAGYDSFTQDCRALSGKYEQFRHDADLAYGELAGLSLLDLLVYASISAFKTELPPLFGLSAPNEIIPHPQFRYPLFAEAVNRLLARRLSCCGEDQLEVSEVRLRACFRTRMYPLLRAWHDDGGVSAAALQRVERYIDAQIQLDGFRQSEISNFCFGAIGDQDLADVALDISLKPEACFEPWVRSQVRGESLHGYWEARSFAVMDELASAQGESLDTMEENGRLEPMVKTLTQISVLHDLYGIEDPIDLGGGIEVSLQQACLMLEMARAHYQATLLLPFLEAMRHQGNWGFALAEVIESGMFDGRQQRFPIIFARTHEKLQLLRQFTVTEEHPSGSEQAAQALLAFFGNDLTAVWDPIHQSHRQLEGSLAEQPFVKLGEYVFTLPWVLTTQDNATALINNLRRVRSRRPKVGEETKRIENRLAEQMRLQGFRTLVGHMPPDGDGEPPGEIDLLAARDGHLFVFEIKSGYVRQTLEAAWHHRASTLRKAGRQLQRKLAALGETFAETMSLRDALGLHALPPLEQIHPWIVDTSVDFDRERFSGYLKVCMTEVLIVLRDEAALLGDDDVPESLYPEGFAAEAFARAIENATLWKQSEHLGLGPIPP